MATVAAKAVYTQLRSALLTIASRMGSDLSVAPKTLRVALFACLALISVVVKALVDNGVLTVAQLLAARDAAVAEVWDDEPIDPPPPA